jgi:hypothetical protein
MYKNNNIYGNSKALNQYAERPMCSPIWGEVQHSLDFKFDLLKSLSTPRLVRQFFTWRVRDSIEANSYFKKNWKFTAIGDPFLYQCQSASAMLELEEKNRVLIVPKYRREENQKIRLEQHIEFAKKFRGKRNSEVVVSLHPGEKNDQNVRHVYESAGITLRNPILFYENDYLLEEARYLSRTAEVHTNYIGTTLLRAVVLGAKGYLLSRPEESKELISNHNVFNSKSSSIAEQEFANNLLGAESILSKAMLKNALSGNINGLFAKHLQRVKFFSEMDFVSILSSRRLKKIKVLCTKCIKLSACKVLRENYVCQSCGYKLRKTDDFYCVQCSYFGKLEDLRNHLANGLPH